MRHKSVYVSGEAILFEGQKVASLLPESGSLPPTMRDRFIEAIEQDNGYSSLTIKVEELRKDLATARAESQRLREEAKEMVETIGRMTLENASLRVRVNKLEAVADKEPQA